MSPIDGQRLSCPACGAEHPSEFRVCPLDGSTLRRRHAGDPLLGTVLAGSYELIGVVARGGMGRVYEARHTRLPRRYAVKVLHSELAEHPAARARFEREGRATSAIRDPHVVDVVDVCATPDGRPAIVAELLDGEDLAMRLRDGEPIEARQALLIARAMARGLAAAHGAGVIHRDLKPSNVFLPACPAEAEAIVIDFGVAKAADEAPITRTGVVVGTPTYMAPEQASGARDVGPAADIYGVGAVLYRLLSGRPPYRGNDSAKVLGQLLSRPPPALRTLAPSVSSEVDAVVDKAMARRPQDRFPDAASLDDALGALLGEAPRGASAQDPAALAAAAAAARPRAVLVGATLSLAVGACALVCLEAWIGSEALAASSTHALVTTAACACAALAASGFWRRAKSRWGSTPELRRLVAPLGAGLLAAAATVGAGTLAASAWSVLSGAEAPSLVRLIGAGAVALLVVGLAQRRRWKLVESPSPKTTEKGSSSTSPSTSMTRPATHAGS